MQGMCRDYFYNLYIYIDMFMCRGVNVCELIVDNLDF